MRTNSSIATLIRSAFAASVLLLGSGVCSAQAVNLTVAPMSTTLPDGQTVPMWGYSCDATQPAQPSPAQAASCAALNASAGGNWSPVRITVPYGGTGTSLTINLTNNLSFATSTATPPATPPNTLPTSLVIVGQLGGGLGTSATTVASPTHNALGVTWFAATPPGTNVGTIAVTSGGSGYVSATTAVTLSGGGGTGAAATAVVSGGVVTAIAVSNPGTGYTSAPSVSITDTSGGSGAAAAASLADVAGGAPTFTPPLQPPRVQSMAAEVTVGGGQTALTWSNLRPGTYLINSGTHPSIQVPMGLYGVLVVTTPGTGSAGQAYSGVSYDADVPLVFGEIDPAQNQAVATVVTTAGFSPTNVWSGQPGQCGDPASPTYNTCFPPAVNYDPRYYLINGVSFDRTNLAASTQAILPATTPASGTVLLRLVNAGLRMHVPAVVGRTMTLYAEDGNLLPGLPKVQAEVFLAAGKTYDVGIKPAVDGTSGNYAAVTLPVYDRQLSLSTNNQRDGGMQAYISIAGGATSGVGSTASATSLKGDSDRVYYCVAGRPLSVTDPSKGLLANVMGANGAAVAGTPVLANPTDTLVLQSNGTFAYTPGASTTLCGGQFSFTINTGAAAVTHLAKITQCDASTAANPDCSAVVGGAPTANGDSYASNAATLFKLGAPGVLSNDTDPNGLPLTAVIDPANSGLPACSSTVTTNCVALNSDGSFKAYLPTGGVTYQFTYLAKNSQGATSAPAAVTIAAPTGSGLAVNITGLTATPVKNPDGSTTLQTVPITDYRWVIEEDRTWYSDPACQINTTGPRVDARGNACPPLPVESLAYSFHTTSMPVVATGCVGTVSCESGQTVLGTPARCDVSNGQCSTDAASKDPLDPKYVALDPNKRYFISILPGDGINPTVTGQGAPVQKDPACDPTSTTCAMRPFNIALDCPNPSDFALGTGQCGHGMGGAPIAPGQTTVNVTLQPTPLPTAQIAVFVYEDDNPLNGENDAGGGVDVLAPNEPGLGGFELKVFDQAGGLGDATGQATYDMFNMPLSNALANTKDPMTGLDACPINARGDGLLGMIPTCPKYESDGKTLSPLAGQAIIANMYPGLYEVVATPGADRIGRGEHWLQTNTLDGSRPHEASIKPAEPAYFQEFGPGGFHISIGFANPDIINGRLKNGTTGLCDPQSSGGGGLTCNSSLTVNVTETHMSRTPDQRVYSTGDYTAYGFTQCYVAMGPPDGADFAFGVCDGNGQVKFSNIPNGDWKLVVFDEWNDITLDGLVNAVGVHCKPVPPATTCDDTQVAVDATQEFPVTQWRTNIYTRTFLDRNGDGVSQDPGEPGLTLVSTNIRYRDGSFGFFNNTDLNGYAGFNEVFPFMNWLVVETDTTRFKNTSIHAVYDTGGPVDGSSPNGTSCAATSPAACGSSTIASRLANTLEQNSLPAALRVPGAVYCTDADCSTTSIRNGGYYNPASPNPGPLSGLSSGRIDPPMPWGVTEAWQGLLGQSSFLEFGMKPFVPGENGGIKGHVIYASTRPFDDPMLLLQLSWETGVPRVKVNLYQEGTAPDGTTSLKLVDSTTSTSFDDWAQGFRKDQNGQLILVADKNGVAPGGSGYIPTGIPNMNCPGQAPDSPFYATLQGSRQFLDPGNQAAPAYAGKLALANNSQFKCFDGWAMLNQVQPAPYDGMYKFPSVTATDPTTGRPTMTNCTACVTNPDDGNPMLPSGKYVVEVIVPPGFELVKEEDKNILMGDIYVAPVATQFTGLGAIFIMPDQAAVNATYNKNNPLVPNSNLGSTTFPRHEGDTGSVETFWPCVGAMRIVPDFMSLFPSAGQNSPFAGALRPLCDRKEVTLQDQGAALAKFYIFTPTHIAGHFTGTITNDLASEFDPFSPQFGEKFGPSNLPVGMRDFAGTEVSRVYSDQWGVYNGLFSSSWEVNPPNPTGYGPTVAIACMNDPGPILDTRAGSATLGQMITDPAYSPAYSNFCYETPFMPGFTAYMDTPVVPVQAFADQYNLPDAEYPNGTPAIKTVTSSAVAGPWVPAVAPVASVNVTNGGGGYTAVPTVSLVPADGNGSGATGTATMSVSTIIVTNPGSGYTSDDLNGSAGGDGVTISGGGGSGASTVASNIQLRIVSFVVANGGTCGNGAHNVNISRNGGAQATATISGGHVTSVHLASGNTGGSYTRVPNVTVSGCPGSDVSALMGVGSITLTNSGSGYTSVPTVTIAPPATGTGATATADLSVNAIAVTPGAGYDAVPAVVISGGGGGGAAATAVLGAAIPSGTLTIAALGDKVVLNPAYSGPNVATPPYNQKTLTRHYGFGSVPSTCPTSGPCPNVTIGGVAMTDVSWSDGQITGTVPAGIPVCSATNPTYTGLNAIALCGELAITTAGGQSSIDAITVTAGGTAPTVLAAGATIQSAVDAANPGDLIIVPPGTYREHVIMWKPVRLQGTGAASVTINADAHPVGVLDPWRRQINCLFGLQINGVPSNAGSLGLSPPSNNFDSTGVYQCPANQFLRADRSPFEAVIGWDASGNGNLAQVLQEPTLMGAYEGAGVTVLGRGARAPDSGPFTFDFWGQSATGGAGAFTDGSTWLTAADCTPNPNPDLGRDYYSSNYYCNPSRIDGLSIINSSQGGGAVFIHGWGHYLELSNTRISANQGTLSGAINLGNGETPDAYINDGVECGTALVGAAAIMPCPPIPPGTPLNAAIPFQFNTHVRVHHNAIIDNASIGDALFSGTPTGAGGVTISAGSDSYQLDHNWIAGNLTSGDGGGVQHVGLSFNGRINNNWILFNQSTNPTLPTNGGGVAIMGANVDRTVSGQECGSTNDVDCVPGIGEGAGGGLVVDANLIIGNSAESGSGGGLRLQQINGTEVAAFSGTPANWYDVTVTNNVIVNNVAGWDGAGMSLEDTLKAKVVNNTIASNDTTASAGVLFKTLGAVMASSPPPGCDPAGITGPLCTSAGNAAHNPQPAGLVTVKNTPNMVASLQGVNTTCPSGYGYTGGTGPGSLNNANCKLLSIPLLTNNLFWQNRAFHVEITGLGTNLQSQQNLVALIPALNQTSTGFCATSGLAADGHTSVPTPYWDVGVRDDVIPNDGAGGAKLSLSNSILTPGVTYNGSNNIYPGTSPVLAQYCNGSRVPPENGGHGYNAPAGRSETTGLSTLFVFDNITPAVTVDEGNNWINLTYGPLTMSKPTETLSSPAELMVASASAGLAGGAYSIGAGSAAVGAGVVVAGVTPPKDFFGSTRSTTKTAIGAIELAALAPTVSGISPNSGFRGTTVAVTISGTNLAGAALDISGNNVAVNSIVSTATSVTANFVIATNANATARTVTVTTSGGSATTTFTVLTPTLTSISPTGGERGTAVSVTLNGTGFAGTPTVTVSGGGGGPNSVTVSNVVVGAGGTSLTATFTIPTGAALGNHNVSVTTDGVTTGTVTFRVTGATADFAVPPGSGPGSMHTGGTGTKAGTVTVTNSGTGANAGPLTFTAAPGITKMSGPASGSFSITGGTCTSSTVLASSQSCTITVQYLPGGSTATSTANVTITATGMATATATSGNFTAN